MHCGSAWVWRGVVPCAPVCLPDGSAGRAGIRNAIPMSGLSWALVSWCQLRTVLN